MKPINREEIHLMSEHSNWTINIGAESFFCQEGEEEKFEAAKYSGLKIDTEGNSILIGLYDENLNQIK